jgi:hypothetical protein
MYRLQLPFIEMRLRISLTQLASHHFLCQPILVDSLLLLNGIDLQVCKVISLDSLSHPGSESGKLVSLGKQMTTEYLLSRTLLPLPAWKTTYDTRNVSPFRGCTPL